MTTPVQDRSALDENLDAIDAELLADRLSACPRPAAAKPRRRRRNLQRGIYCYAGAFTPSSAAPILDPLYLRRRVDTSETLIDKKSKNTAQPAFSTSQLLSPQKRRIRRHRSQQDECDTYDQDSAGMGELCDSPVRSAPVGSATAVVSPPRRTANTYEQYKKEILETFRRHINVRYQPGIVWRGYKTYAVVEWNSTSCCLSQHQWYHIHTENPGYFACECQSDKRIECWHIRVIKDVWQNHANADNYKEPSHPMTIEQQVHILLDDLSGVSVRILSVLHPQAPAQRAAIVTQNANTHLFHCARHVSERVCPHTRAAVRHWCGDTPETPDSEVEKVMLQLYQQSQLERGREREEVDESAEWKLRQSRAPNRSYRGIAIPTAFAVDDDEQTKCEVQRQRHELVRRHALVSWAVAEAQQQPYVRILQPTEQELAAPHYFLSSDGTSVGCEHQFVLRAATLPPARKCYILYDMSSSSYIHLYEGYCSHCHTRLPYDGCDEGVFNYNNHQLFTHDLLNDYTFQWQKSSTPWHAFASTIANRYEQRGYDAGTSVRASGNSQLAFVTSGTFGKVWLAFVNLQQFNFRFVCTLGCGKEPRVVVADGTVFPFPAELMHSEICPPTKPHANAITIHNKPFCMYFLTDAHLGALLRRCVGQLYERDKKYKDVGAAFRPLTAPKMAELQTELAQIVPATGELLATLSRWKEEAQAASGPERSRKTKRIKAVANLLRIVASREPITQLVDSNSAMLLRAFLTCPALYRLPDYRMALAAHCPSIYQLFETYKVEIRSPGNSNDIRYFDLQLDDNLVAVIKEILGRVQEVQDRLPTFNEAQPEHFNNQQFLPDDDPRRQFDCDDPTNSFAKRGSYYGLNVKRLRNKYDNDSVRLDKEDKGCNHYFEKMRHFTGGVMMFWCPHRICLGFHVVPTSEGRDDVFSVLFTRWQTPPKIVIYDFACNLHKYSFSREPKFFANTKFLVDELHGGGHATCSEAYMIKTYKAIGEATARFVNDSAAESGHKLMKGQKTQLLYMRQENYMMALRLKMELHNRLTHRSYVRHEHVPTGPAPADTYQFVANLNDVTIQADMVKAKSMPVSQ